ncbi:MAG: PD-(D/E)XK nuclease family protein [Candidatus Vogelbacteria bacterium]|nr:PD-(D/E)XK nuclease family protein [Candidatus Vogelbacteria bacterium]
MTKYRKGKGKIFDPKSVEPFRISRTKIDLFLGCPRCFYLDQRLGVKRPDTYPLTLNLAVDALLKKEFDLHRAKQTAHPMMKKYGLDALPFKHEKINSWRELDFGRGGIHHWHQETNFDVYGVVDDVWITPKKELVVVDYKATAKVAAPTLEGELGAQYKRQMEVYQWLLSKNDFKVSPIGYFVYVNGRRDAAAFDGRLEFEVSILPCEGDPRWIPKALDEMKQTLLAPAPPQSSADCDFCLYRQAAGLALSAVPVGGVYPQTGQVALW